MPFYDGPLLTHMKHPDMFRGMGDHDPMRRWRTGAESRECFACGMGKSSAVSLMGMLGTRLSPNRVTRNSDSLVMCVMVVQDVAT